MLVRRWGCLILLGVAPEALIVLIWALDRWNVTYALWSTMQACQTFIDTRGDAARGVWSSYESRTVRGTTVEKRVWKMRGFGRVAWIRSDAI
ncbi:hypothetical protein PR001_g26217 [Phytophthora rubi]|uniref:Uncharacterized protein n=1 Tax=Phytophthora rubi TaxID=129364 RepID=A0A6A3HUP8_9STRA|nr:hypothetical protein PR001_g26217 [Phytophthora rubi]